mmetsp:Transcript_26178/g.75588  ORF Transcript_26178/g.75588 Transcript_26178/m.75588 type:complete len:431 (-) Transcript_26178:88-1380(-)
MPTLLLLLLLLLLLVEEATSTTPLLRLLFALGGPLFGLSLGGKLGSVGRRLGLEERIHPHLRLGRGLDTLLQLLNLPRHALGIEAHILDEKLLELGLLAGLPLELNIRQDLVVVEQPPRLDVDGNDVLLFAVVVTIISRLELAGWLLVIFILTVIGLLGLLLFLGLLLLGLDLVGDPIVGNSILVPIQVLQDLLDTFVLTDELERRLGPDASDGIAIIATEEDAQINELIVRNLQPRQSLGIVQLLDVRLLGGGEGHLADLDGGAEGQAIHILRAGRPHGPLPGQSGRLSLGLARGVDDGHAHEAKELLTVLILLRSRPHQTLLLLVLLLDVALLPCLLELGLGLLTLLPSLRQLSRLDVGRLPVEHVHGSDPLRQEADGPVEHALYVRGGFALGVRELHRRGARSAAPHGDQELVDGHRRIDGDLAPLE